MNGKFFAHLCVENSQGTRLNNKINKIRDLFKVKLYAIRSETKRERERERVREREKSEREILNVH